MWLVQLQCPRTHLARSSRHPHPTRGVEHGRKSRRRGRGARARDGRDSSESDWRVRFAALEGEIAASSRGDSAVDVPPFRSRIPLSSLMSLPFPAPVRSPVIPITSSSRRRTQPCIMRNGSRGRHCHTDTHRITRCCCLRPRASGRCCCCITARWWTQRLAVGRCRQS